MKRQRVKRSKGEKRKAADEEPAGEKKDDKTMEDDMEMPEGATSSSSGQGSPPRSRT